MTWCACERAFVNLEAAGHDVVLAADGVTALERIARSQPDCVVLDVMMPVLDGWGVLERLRDDHLAPPVLVVSAKSAPADVARARDLGAADYLVKPLRATTSFDASPRSSPPDRAVKEPARFRPDYRP